jgi:hypothetical protein
VSKGLTGTKVGVLQEACVFITDFQDGPNDEVAKICDGTSKNLTKEQSYKKLHDFLKGVEKEYDDCLEQSECKAKMTKSMQDNLVSIKGFVLKLEPKSTDDSTPSVARNSTHLPQANVRGGADVKGGGQESSAADSDKDKESAKQRAKALAREKAKKLARETVEEKKRRQK